jgi:hypothetical protein
MATFSRKDGIFSALALAILLIGMATGSAVALFVMSIIGLSVAAVLYRKQFGTLLLPTVVATITAAAAVALIVSAR